MSILNRLHLYCNNTFAPFYQHPQEDASQLGDLEKFLRELGLYLEQASFKLQQCLCIHKHFFSSIQRYIESSEVQKYISCLILGFYGYAVILG